MNTRLLLVLLGLAGIAYYFRDKISQAVSTGITTMNDPLPKLIERFEGRRNFVYKDSAGNPTIGVGHKIILPQEQYLLAFTPQNPAPDSLIDKLFDADISGAKGLVDSQVKVQLNPNQYAALVSFAFNLGGPQFIHSSTLRLLNQGDMKGAADAMLLWNKSGGQPILTSRREAERDIFNAPVMTA